MLNIRCIVEGTLDGLEPGEHGLAVHEAGDVSRGCHSLGDHYNPRLEILFENMIIFIDDRAHNYFLTTKM